MLYGSIIKVADEIVLGLNAPMFKGYLCFIANRRAQQIGIESLCTQEENLFPWMSEMIGIKKERNFFETRVTECQTGGALNRELCDSAIREAAAAVASSRVRRS